MADEIKPAEKPAEKPKPLRLKVRCAPGGDSLTLVDADTGGAVLLDAHVRLDVGWHPKQGGSARVVAVFPDCAVECDQAADGTGQGGPFEVHGALVGGSRPGFSAGGLTLAPADLGTHLPAGTPSVKASTPGEDPNAFNRRMNEQHLAGR